MSKVDFNALSIFDIDLSFFKEQGIKVIFTDLDNTLDRFDQKLPTEKVINLKKELDSNDLRLIIVSNNNKKRVSTYAEALGVNYLSSAGKPFARKFLSFLSSLSYDKNEVCLIGDQLLTDGKMARRAKVKFVLTEPIYKEEQWTTYFNRIIDRPLRKSYRKKGLLGIECPKKDSK